jgi:hypothetical protein
MPLLPLGLSQGLSWQHSSEEALDNLNVACFSPQTC